MPRENNKSICPECKNTALFLDERSGDLVCKQCGLVIDEKIIDYSHEGKRIYNDEQYRKLKQTEKNSIINPHDSKTTFPKSKYLSFYDKKFKKLEKINKSLSREIKNISRINLEISRLIGALKLPDSLNPHVIKLFLQAKEKNLHYGYSIEDLIGVCLFYILRQKRFPILFEEMLENLSERNNKTRLFRLYYLLIKTLELKNEPFPIELFIPKFCSELEIPFSIGMELKPILQVISLAEIGNMKPTGIILAGLILLCKKHGKKITKSHNEITEIGYISPLTLRNCIKKLKPFIGV